MNHLIFLRRLSNFLFEGLQFANIPRSVPSITCYILLMYFTILLAAMPFFVTSTSGVLEETLGEQRKLIMLMDKKKF